ncbi:S8 family serine peptidase [Plantactinospora sp. GCM10030261]|uniref:S8 family peptidase n=1 Tax=Plantactinospora sp. GCM10030261 TaxID=3273420 RepID=UPI003619301A
MGRGIRASLTGLAAALFVVAAGGVAANAGADTGPAGGPRPSVLPAGKTYTVTLLTGDVVTVHSRGSGCPTVSVESARPDSMQRRSCGPDGHVRVIPAEVAGLLGSTLDESLFDVTSLIMQGYDDASTDTLPLIVTGVDGNASGARSATDPLAAGLRAARPLKVIDAIAGRQPKAKGAEFLRAVSARATSQRTAKPAGDRTRIWLDGRVRATGVAAAAPDVAVPRSAPSPASAEGQLDRNLRQVGAPAAWTAGYTGRGTTVAVLDTGVDATHPDLAGKVAERADFTAEGGDAGDRHGHGTHVAATIAGTGAAAGGERRGVAYDARLLVGKVLDDRGEGTDSQVIAGMEWAAPRADVVNMSLGAFADSDGTDPVSLALDELTARHGALFVVAAGNDGPFPVSAPAAAKSALTVGAVDASDKLAGFSRHGPQPNTWAAKPELVAPGVDIVAARAAGTSIGRPVDDHYTAASGTSMATPHVAGTAALLAQRHPQWTSGQLKAALVGGVDPLTGTAGDAYRVGAGRVNAARPLTDVTSAQGLVTLDPFAYPQQGTTRASLGWHNAGSGPVTVTLKLSVRDYAGKTAPDGAARLSTGTVTIPAGQDGSAVLDLTRAAFAGRPGLYTARIVAETTGGGRLAETVLPFYVQPRSFDLTITAAGLANPTPGADARAYATVVNLNDPALYYRNTWIGEGAGSVTIRVPAGRYSVMGVVSEYDPVAGEQRGTLGGDADVTVTADTSVLIDGAGGKPVTASVDGFDTHQAYVNVSFLQTSPSGVEWYDGVSANGATAAAAGVRVQPVDRPGVGTFQAYTGFSLQATDSNPSTRVYDLIRPLGGSIPADPTYRVTSAEQAKLARIDQRFHRLDMAGSTTGHQRYGFSPEGLYMVEQRSPEVPGTRADYVTPGYEWTDRTLFDAELSFPSDVSEASRRYAAGSVQPKAWVRQPLRPDWYDDPAAPAISCNPVPPNRSRGIMFVELVDLTDEHQRFDCVGGGWDGWDENTKRKLRLYEGGRLVGEHAESFGDFTVPQKAANYRLTYDLDASALLPVSSKVNTAWTFRSTGPTGTGTVPLSLLSVDYELPLDLNNKPSPVDRAATFRVHQALGVATQRVTSFNLWTSTDAGATWSAVPVTRGDDGRFTAQLPQPEKGQAVSLKVKAAADGGSGIEQSIIDAYRAG